MKKVKQILFVLLFSGLAVHGQFYHFAIQFNSKDTVAFNTSSPENFLSTRAVARKTKFQIPIDISDFPITQTHLNAIAQHNFSIRTYSKWFNTIVVQTSDSSLINKIDTLPFVSNVKFIGKSNLNASRVTRKNESLEINYGNSDFGIKQVNGNSLHDKGFLGKGITIAVLDAGFINVDVMDIFTPLYDEQRIIATRNFVSKSNLVTQMDTHGTEVLSVLAGNKTGEYVGSAPEANYLLLITEDTREENLIEEYFWIQAVEYADSLGTDIISSSLGYNTFDTPALNHSKSELGQQTVLISNGARRAVEKGMLVVNSAGNEGNNSWTNLLFPADEEFVLTVAAINSQGNVAPFSSTGNPSMGFIKPNVAALGEQISLSSSNGNYAKRNGTSYACPIVSGLAACLWQSFPNKTQFEIKSMIETSAHQYSNPDYQIGYGIPNFTNTLANIQSPVNHASDRFDIFPNPLIGESLFIKYPPGLIPQEIQLYNSKGEKITGTTIQSEEQYSTIQVQFSFLGPGIYFIKLISQDLSRVHRLVVH